MKPVAVFRIMIWLAVAVIVCAGVAAAFGYDAIAMAATNVAVWVGGAGVFGLAFSKAGL